MKHRLLLIVLFALTMLSCQDKINIVKVDNWAKKSVDYSELYTFLSKASNTDDYLKNLSYSGNKLTIKTKSGASITLSEQCHLIEMNTRGKLIQDGIEIGIQLNTRDTWYEAPKIDISAEYKLSIEGTQTNLITPGLVIINCGKYVYFYSNNIVFALKSEINEAFNPPLPRDKSLLKVLFVGNSFNVDATTHLPGILSAMGCDRILMGRAYHGAYTLPLYNTNYANSNICAYRVCRPGQDEWDDNEVYDHSLKEVIEAEDWDIISFMEYTGNEASWTWNETEAGHINSLIQHCFDAHPDKRPTIMFMLTQTFALQHSAMQKGTYKTVVDYFNADQSKMYETITTFAKNVVNNTCIDDVIATGTAIENLRTSRLNTDPVQNLSRDGFHLDYGISRYTAACTVFYNIFEPVLGLKLDNNTYRYDVSIAHNNDRSTPVTDDNVELCRKAARFATDKPFEITNMSNL